MASLPIAGLPFLHVSWFTCCAAHVWLILICLAQAWTYNACNVIVDLLSLLPALMGGLTQQVTHMTHA